MVNNCIFQIFLINHIIGRTVLFLSKISVSFELISFKLSLRHGSNYGINDIISIPKFSNIFGTDNNKIILSIKDTGRGVFTAITFTY